MERDIIKETTELVNKIDWLIDETFSGIPELELTAIIAGRAEMGEFGAAIKGKHVGFRFIVEQGAADKYFPDMTGKRFELVEVGRPPLTVRANHKVLQELSNKVDSLNKLSDNFWDDVKAMLKADSERWKNSPPIDLTDPLKR